MKIISNLGSTVAYLIAFIVLWVFLGILYFMKSISTIETIYNYLLSHMKWTWSLFFMYSQLCPLLMSSIINFYDLEFTSPMEIFQSVLSLLIPTIIVLALIIQIIVLRTDIKLTEKSIETIEYR